MNSSAPEINTLLFIERLNKKNKKTETRKKEKEKEIVNKIDKNANIKYPHKTGLQNIGQTSYMNSSIQCLSNIKYLSDYFIKHYGQFNIEKQPLYASFSSLIFELFNAKKNYISPEIFKKIIGKLNPSFEDMHESDPKDLISFLLETLHQELNKANNSPQAQIDFNINEADSYDENKALQNFINDFIKKNKSIVSDIFYGTIRSTEKCHKCKRIKYSFKTFNLLIFKLKSIKGIQTKNNG
jgi:ubiquitin C-terminal hydrolase